LADPTKTIKCQDKLRKVEVDNGKVNNQTDSTLKQNKNFTTRVASQALIQASSLRKPREITIQLEASTQ
jgi:hypothetical protein